MRLGPSRAPRPRRHDGDRAPVPAAPADAPPDPEYWRPGILEDLATRAGLTPEQAFDLTWASEYPDDETLGRAMMAPAGIATLVGPEQEDEVRAAIVGGLAPHRTPDGGYRMLNEFHFLITRA